MDGGWKPDVEMAPSCPRCGSSHTKFCYYNNYSLTQPRYFCKGCRRYWTKGGSLRNVPVGGGCRKNRRGSNNNRSLLRLPSNGGIVHSRSLDDLATKHPYDHDHDHPRSDGDDHHHRSSGSSHIDLAVVYANFLNPHPDSNPSGFDEIPSELPCEFDPSALEFANLEEPNLYDNEQFVYHPPPTLGPSIFNNSNDDGLPPLPGADHLEAVSGEISWPDDDNHGFPMIDQQQLIVPESHQDPDHLLFGNWSPFHFSR